MISSGTPGLPRRPPTHPAAASTSGLRPTGRSTTDRPPTDLGYAPTSVEQDSLPLGLLPNFTPETIPGTTDADVALLMKDTLLGRLPRLAEVADTAAYLASDASGAMTGAVINLTCGTIID